MKIGLIALPDLLEGIKVPYSNLHGIWNPPSFVLSFWATGAIVEFQDNLDYVTKKEKILKSHQSAAGAYLEKV